MKARIVFIIIVMFAMQACLKDEMANSNQEIFMFVWNDMDQNYGGFIPRNIDWEAIFVEYNELVNLSNDEDELWEICTEMLEQLNDGHIKLFNTNNDEGFSSGRGCRSLTAKEFDITNVKNNYIEDFKSILIDGEELIYGQIKNENIGYIYLPNFEYDGSDWHLEIDNILNELQNTDGLILDLRNNSGGTPLLDRYIAKRFVNEEKLVFYVQTRNGKEHDNFDEPTPYYATTEGTQYKKDIFILTNKTTISAGEEFILFLASQNHVTIVGDTTAKAFSSESFRRLLPNGWEFGLPNQLYTYPDGSSPEGVGIIPDIYIKNDTIEVQNGLDKVLERAIEEL